MNISYLIAVRLAVIIVFFTGFFSCKEEERPIIERTKQNDTILPGYFNMDSFIVASMSQIGEPALGSLKREAYRFIYHRPFGSRYEIFRIERTAGDSFLLTTQIAGFSGSDSDYVFYSDTAIRYKNFILLDSAVQRLSYDDWYKVRDIISGTFYWHYDNPINYPYQILDGDHLIMESNTWYRTGRADSFLYHVNHIHPMQAGFRDAVILLGKRSKLTKRWAERGYFGEN